MHISIARSIKTYLPSVPWWAQGAPDEEEEPPLGVEDVLEPEVVWVDLLAGRSVNTGKRNAVVSYCTFSILEKQILSGDRSNGDMKKAKLSMLKKTYPFGNARPTPPQSKQYKNDE